MAEQDEGEKSAAILRFPLSRATPPGSAGGFVDLGVGAMARRLGMREGQMTGHWCSRCKESGSAMRSRSNAHVAAIGMAENNGSLYL
ncbi:hypothetical protein [Methylocapsa acidiphila]|uniref:hypothetical protein n=1 Tax=Methylocapsa acidiphila TaxID=133552 RepID=UPI001FDA0CA5|nr:hypothetical protein [Methylocapsa acidiphila]